MKYISFENQQNGSKYLIKTEILTRLEVQKHDNPESNRLILFVYESDRIGARVFEVDGFEYDRFVSFLEGIGETTEFFKIDVMK